MKNNDKSRLGCNPMVDFLLVGAQKSGTTTLHSYLEEHPNIGMARKKEVHFFNNNDHYGAEDAPNYDWYHSFFDESEECVFRGEATPAYMYCRDGPKRIWKYNPKMKIIVILRNPIERAYSHWNMEVLRGAEHLGFFEALRHERDRCREALPGQHYVYSYIDRGFYSTQIRELWRFFGKEQVLILKYDDLKTTPERLLDEMYGHLGIDNNFSVNSLNKEKFLHKAKYKSEMSDEAKVYLQGEYEYEILSLQAMLGGDFSDWLG